MFKEIYSEKIKELPEFIRQMMGLVILVIVIISSFFVLNIMFGQGDDLVERMKICLLYTSPSPRDRSVSRMPSSA